MAENTTTETEEDPYDLLRLSFPTKAQTGSADPYDLDQFSKTKDSFLTNLIEGATFRGDRTPSSPMSETLPELLAENLVGSIGIMKGAKAASMGVTATTGFRGKVMNFVDDLTLQIDKAPKRYLAGGTLLPTVGGVTGREVSRNIAPESELAAFFGEFGGSLTADLGPGLVKKGVVSALELVPTDNVFNKYLLQPVGNVKNMIGGFFERARSGVDPFNVTPRSRKTFEEAGVTRESILEGDIARGRQQEVLPGAEPFMTPAVRADNYALMQLEKEVVENAKDNKLTNKVIQDLESINRVVIDGFQFGDANSYAQFMQNRVLYYDELMEAQIQTAAIEAEEAAQQMGRLIDPDGTPNPARTQQRANEITFARIDANLKSARSAEKEKWTHFATLAGGKKFETSNFAKTYNAIVQGANKVERQNIPRVSWLEVDEKKLEELIEGMDKTGIAVLDQLDPDDIPYMIGESVTAPEIRSMISQLRGIHRSALTGDSVNYQTAHWANELAESLNKDLLETVEESAPDLSDAITDATSFSSSYNRIFRNDTIQNMYLKNSAGQRRVKPGEALTSAGLFRVEGARESLDDIILATGVDPKTLQQVENADPVVIKALEDYLTFSLVDDGTFNVDSARKMLVDNELLLSRLPEFQKRLRNVVELNDLSALKIDQTRQAFEPAKALATTFLNKNVDVITSDIINNPNPTAYLAKIMREVAQDQTGAALMGLKQSFADYIFKNSQSSARMVMNGPMTRFVSGAKLNDIMGNENMSGLITMLFTPAEQRRWNQIRATAERVSRRQSASGTAGPIDRDLASQFMSGTAAIGGAIVGGEAGSASLGGSFQLANRFARMFENTYKNWINDPTAVFMRDAIFDQTKLDALFENLAEEGADISAYSSFLRDQMTKVGSRPYTYSPLIHGINPADEKGENEM